jgi:hypothetical protein
MHRGREGQLQASRFSHTVATGIRVSLNTHAPLTLPGMLSTAGHWDQSRDVMFLSRFHRKRSYHGSTASSLGAASIKGNFIERITDLRPKEGSTLFSFLQVSAPAETEPSFPSTAARDHDRFRVHRLPNAMAGRSTR